MIKIKNKLVSFNQAKSSYSLNEDAIRIKSENDKLVKNLVCGTDSRFVVIAGPCGVDNVDAAIEYVDKLSKINIKYSDKLVVFPRLFLSKPRSNGEGFCGRLMQKYGECVDINEGILSCRKLLVDCITKYRMPIADEMLYPELHMYLDDLISLWVVGARSNLSSLHRNVASGIDVAVGVKNTVSGNISLLCQSLQAVTNPKEFAFCGNQVQTSGNKSAFAILRGNVDENNIYHSNFSNDNIEAIINFNTENNIFNNRILIDCSHANSGKDARNQLENAIKIANLHNVNKIIGGIMLESYLYEGHSDSGYGISKIDSCISFEQTEKLINEVYDIIV